MEHTFMPLLNGFALMNFETMAIVGLIILVLFGGSKIPQLMRGVGRGISEFKAGIDEGKNTIKQGLDDASKPTTTSSAE